ncbi:hypothetical protein [Kribbella solani]|uniref:DUF3558 domain-containing protein n=1 Tax=Kribbella solani TaxID=236067 RepID=A0A841DGY9_9ACTN|nr:hypothetical protein [Kribbella solani]MBB5977161.1 hypothetical protein [Kribbella solani]
MRRIITLAATAGLALALPACDPATTQQSKPSPTPTPAANLCDQVRPHLPGTWTTESGAPSTAAPLSDNCSLVDSAQPARRIRVSLSVLPVTDKQAAAYRKHDESMAASGGYVAKVTDGGAGAGSWALEPAAAAPWLVFRTANHQVRLRIENAGAGTMADLRLVARTVNDLSGRLSSMPAVIARPECERGTSAAENILGGKAVVRRDAVVDGRLWCQWGSTARTAWVSSGSAGSDASMAFVEIKSAGTGALRPAHKVSVGAEGWQQDDGLLAFRTSSGAYVMVGSTPGDEMRPIPIVTLARAIAPAYE